MFIDSVLANGVSKIGRMNETSSFFSEATALTARTGDCKTVIVHPALTLAHPGLEIDWKTFVGVNSFFRPPTTDRWAARVLARTKLMAASKDKPDEVVPYGDTVYVGVVVEPGTEGMTNRLIRAFEVYGKSCATVQDGPF